MSRLGGTGGGGSELGELLRTFPDSTSAQQVRPAIGEQIKYRVTALKGADPCAATEVLRSLGTTASEVPAEGVKALPADADKGIGDGVYACGVGQFKDEEFGDARTTSTDPRGDGPAGLPVHQLPVRHRAESVRAGRASAPGPGRAGAQPWGRGFFSMTRPSRCAVRWAPPCASET
ncbi:hypothetical protein [Streptomyces sp. NPDC048142]|uniref:hypothetical protein n=1 Tax=Streptomyces sp. NPDC048142 TaxID=3365501 RepID=UPI003714F867